MLYYKESLNWNIVALFFLGVSFVLPSIFIPPALAYPTSIFTYSHANHQAGILVKRQAEGGAHDHHNNHEHKVEKHGSHADHKQDDQTGHANHVGGNGVPMRMFFHTDYHDFFLLEEFVTTNIGTYWAALIGIYIFSCGYALFLYQVKPCLYCRFLHTSPEKVSSIKTELLRLGYAFLLGLELCYSLILMLIVMSFNVGWCIAVIAGVFLGTYLFRRGEYYAPNGFASSVLPKDPRESSGLCC